MCTIDNRCPVAGAEGPGGMAPKCWAHPKFVTVKLDLVMN